MKTPMTPYGIEPATFRFVEKYLNHCATISGPQLNVYEMLKHFNTLGMFFLEAVICTSSCVLLGIYIFTFLHFYIIEYIVVF
jgi:hypothetical protein